VHDDDEIGGLIRALRKVADTHLGGETRRVGLSATEYAVLLGIAADPGVEPRRLAVDIAIDRLALAGAVRRLEAKRLLRRDPAADRATRLRLTGRGEALLTDAAPGLARALERTCAPLTPDERQVFLGLLDRVVGQRHHWH
jgi:DNA-binding MarR family transcriptional regulator